MWHYFAGICQSVCRFLAQPICGETVLCIQTRVSYGYWWESIETLVSSWRSEITCLWKQGTYLQPDIYIYIYIYLSNIIYLSVFGILMLQWLKHCITSPNLTHTCDCGIYFSRVSLSAVCLGSDQIWG